MTLLEQALAFATKAHENQKRKYTGEPYIVHPVEVAHIVASVGGTDTMQAAALLHDTVEDTDTTLADITNNFGADVATLVEMLTDVSTLTDGNRKIRKAIDLAHTAKASPQAKTIKLADLISNTKSIVAHDKYFARVYLREKEALLNVLQEGNSDLYMEAQTLLIKSYLELKGH